MLKINMEYRKGILFVRLKGELIRYSYHDLTKYIIPIIEEKGIKYIVFNLDNLTVIDNYGKMALKMVLNVLKDRTGKGLICTSSIPFDNSESVVSDELKAFTLLKV